MNEERMALSGQLKLKALAVIPSGNVTLINAVINNYLPYISLVQYR